MLKLLKELIVKVSALLLVTVCRQRVMALSICVTTPAEVLPQNGEAILITGLDKCIIKSQGRSRNDVEHPNNFGSNFVCLSLPREVRS